MTEPVPTIYALLIGIDYYKPTNSIRVLEEQYETLI